MFTILAVCSTLDLFVSFKPILVWFAIDFHMLALSVVLIFSIINSFKSKWQTKLLRANSLLGRSCCTIFLFSGVTSLRNHRNVLGAFKINFIKTFCRVAVVVLVVPVPSKYMDLCISNRYPFRGKGKNEGYDQYDKKNKERERDRVASVLHLFNTTPQQEQVYNNK